MPIPSWAEFEVATNNKKLLQRARGPNIALVDEALKAWHNRMGLANPDEKVALLATLLTACSRWLKLKIEASNDELRLKRKLAISNLAQAALDELQTVGARSRLQIDFDKRKFQVLGGLRRTMPAVPPGAAFASQLRGLSQGYSHERVQYLKGKKQAPFSGTRLQQFHESLRSRDALSEQIAKKRFTQLTEHEFQELGRLAKANDDYRYRVKFLKKHDRTNYWIRPGAQGKFYDIHDRLVNAPEFTETTYAIDEYGNLFVAPIFQRSGVGPAIFSHSSFNAGKPVICAGLITIEQGVLKEIDNHSGHYKPTRQDLISALQCLSDDGADLKETIVIVHAKEGGGEFRALDLLRTAC
jgi:hypothetical protein